jgi:hypothetical protein
MSIQDRSERVLKAIREHAGQVKNQKQDLQKTTSVQQQQQQQQQNKASPILALKKDAHDENVEKNRFLAALSSSPQQQFLQRQEQFLIRPGMTVQERVEVRAAQLQERKRLEQLELQQQQQQEQQEQQASASGSGGGGSGNQATMTRQQQEQYGEWLLTCAEVLFFRARDIWQRQERCFQKETLLRQHQQQLRQHQQQRQGQGGGAAFGYGSLVHGQARSSQPLLGTASSTSHFGKDDDDTAMNTNQNNIAFHATPFIMTLRDVFILLSKSMATTTAPPTSIGTARDGKKLTRRRLIVNAVQDLSRRLPEWIQLTRLTTTTTNNNKQQQHNKLQLDPDATTVWIKPGVSYTTIQAKLVGRRVSNNKKAASATGSIAVTSCNNTNDDDNNHAEQQQQQRFQVANRKRPPPTRFLPGFSKSHFPASDATTTTTATTTHSTMTTTAAATTVTAPEPTAPATKKTRTTLASMVASAARTAKNHVTTTATSQHHSCATADIMTTATAPSTTLSSPPLGKNNENDRKRKMTSPHHHSANNSNKTNKTALAGAAGVASPLRINPHLILTDADYSGGERLFKRKNSHSVSSSSPRGLKSLFTQLNAGQRI